MKTHEELLKMHGYKGDEMLMNPATGSVDTAENWALDCVSDYEQGKYCETYLEEIEEIFPAQFSSLVEVEEGEDGEWIEKKI